MFEQNSLKTIYEWPFHESKLEVPTSHIHIYGNGPPLPDPAPAFDRWLIYTDDSWQALARHQMPPAYQMRRQVWSLVKLFTRMESVQPLQWGGLERSQFRRSHSSRRRNRSERSPSVGCPLAVDTKQCHALYILCRLHHNRQASVRRHRSLRARPLPQFSDQGHLWLNHVACRLPVQRVNLPRLNIDMQEWISNHDISIQW